MMNLVPFRNTMPHLVSGKARLLRHELIFHVTAAGDLPQYVHSHPRASQEPYCMPPQMIQRMPHAYTVQARQQRVSTHPA